jgi:hypothetical protein
VSAQPQREFRLTREFLCTLFMLCARFPSLFLNIITTLSVAQVMQGPVGGDGQDIQHTQVTRGMYEVLIRKSEGSRPLEDQDESGWIILKWIEGK